MLVSVIIPTKDRPVALVDAVQSVFDGSYQNFEIFVVDQSPGDACRDALARFTRDPRFHYLTNRKPGYGAASSRNLGIAASSGSLIAVIDDDVEVRRDWMQRIVDEFANDPELQFISGALTAPPYDASNGGYTPEFRPHPGISRWQLPSAVAGANLSFRRSLLERVGGYDEFCGPGSRLGASDDGDITWRILRSGAKWKATSEIEVIHTHGFRPGPAGDAVYDRYQYGNGGNFGRFSRRGDLVALGFFVAQECRRLVTSTARLIKGQKPAGFRHARLRLHGFVHGFLLPPDEGFVSGAELARRRAELLAEKRDERASSPGVPSS